MIATPRRPATPGLPDRPRAGPWLAIALAFFVQASAASETSTSSTTRWTMINVTPKAWQADCNLIEFPDGTRALIDSAEASDSPPVLLPYLASRSIDHLNLVVISHFHVDHYGRLKDLINGGIKIDRVAINMPAAREIADQEKPWGMIWEDVEALLAFLRERGVPYFTPEVGAKLVDLVAADGAPVCLEVLCRYDGINTPVGKTYVNDTSIVLRLSHGRTRALFTGDLDSKLGAWLAQSPMDLRSDLLKAPHHGGEGHPPNDFYDRVAPRVALVSTSGPLWGSPRCIRFRTYVTDHQIPTYITGLDGTIIVEMTRNGFSIATLRKPQFVFYQAAMSEK